MEEMNKEMKKALKGIRKVHKKRLKLLTKKCMLEPTTFHLLEFVNIQVTWLYDYYKFMNYNEGTVASLKEIGEKLKRFQSYKACISRGSLVIGESLVEIYKKMNELLNEIILDLKTVYKMTSH